MQFQRSDTICNMVAIDLYAGKFFSLWPSIVTGNQRQAHTVPVTRIDDDIATAARKAHARERLVSPLIQSFLPVGL